MNYCLQPRKRKARRWRDIQTRKSKAGVAARERLRRERNAAECEKWKLVRSVLLYIHASPDGKRIALQAFDSVGEWHKCGTERATLNALRKIAWRLRRAST